jgi:hypothetical protein
MKRTFALSGFLLLSGKNVECFTFGPSKPAAVWKTALPMALDDATISRLDGIRRSFLALTERLGDPDVLGDSSLLQKVMTDRAKSEEVVLVYDEYCGLLEGLADARELFQEAGDDFELKEMARSEIKEIEPKMGEMGDKMKLLLLPKDPNDDRNIMLEIRAGTGGSEANIFCGVSLTDLLRSYRRWWSQCWIQFCLTPSLFIQVICSMSTASTSSTVDGKQVLLMNRLEMMAGSRM